LSGPGARRRGTVYLVGAGPGDPGLITVRGRELMARADVVIADALVSAELLRGLRPDTELLKAGGAGGRRQVGQERINRIMIARARRGLTVVRLKGGDPSLFGRIGEETEALRAARIRFEIVPGVTAALGAAATAGIPLTHRRHASSVLFVTGHLDSSKPDPGIDWRGVAAAGTIVLYMGVERLESIGRRLIAAGRDRRTPAALIRWATRSDQQVLEGTLASIAGLARRAAFAPPALLVVGGVVGLRRAPGWFDRRPLRGRTILVTRPREQAGAFTGLLEEEGARVIDLPAIEIRPPRSWAPLDRALARLETFHLLIFTSANGVARFFDRLSARRIDLRALHGIDLVAIGPATAAALTGRGLRVAAVPEEFRAEGIVRVLQRRALLGTRVLIPRAEAARDLLVRELRCRGARVEVAPVYRTVPSREGVGEARRMLRQGGVDLVTFASSSSVTHFLGKFRDSGDRRRLRRLPAAAIGPITARTARRAGFRVVVMPKRFTIPALASAIVKKLRSSPSGTPRGS